MPEYSEMTANSGACLVTNCVSKHPSLECSHLTGDGDPCAARSILRETIENGRFSLAQLSFFQSPLTGNPFGDALVSANLASGEGILIATEAGRCALQNHGGKRG